MDPRVGIPRTDRWFRTYVGHDHHPVRATHAMKIVRTRLTRQLQSRKIHRSR